MKGTQSDHRVMEGITNMAALENQVSPEAGLDVAGELAGRDGLEEGEGAAFRIIVEDARG